MKRIYLSGPITGMPDENRPAFLAAAAALRAYGYSVVNPHELPHEKNASWEAHMCVDLKALLDCDTLVLLNEDWSNSRGVSLEVYNATILGKQIMRLDTALSLARHKQPLTEGATRSLVKRLDDSSRPLPPPAVRLEKIEAPLEEAKP